MGLVIPHQEAEDGWLSSKVEERECVYLWAMGMGKVGRNELTAQSGAPPHH